ncbi:MAG: phosphoribosylamine--glycine ligase [Alteraurantiacibacter sp. bin_em_oilr2.035]|nr:phosphoribosylamine--glycine ligase [Alteraurantiacibacter sp. bin_em_oilr2.035]
MNILVLGSGGREHALCWKLAQSRAIKSEGGTLYVSPGNPGMEDVARITQVDVTHHADVIAFAKKHDIGLVVIGPEAPLVDGLADSLRDANIASFGPSAQAAQLEGSKAFTKALCDKAGIPTAAYVRCTTLEEGRQALNTFAPPFVLKADGLAAGKGVVIAESAEHAEEALADMLGGAFGEAGAEVVIEEFMHGEEASFFALTDGEAVIPFGTAQDHKRVGEGDTGPNTGGMGAYSPARVLTDAQLAETMDRIILPTVRQMKEDGMPYCGVLYAGLMLTDEGVKLVEYNCRFGDPECQVLMMRLDSDLADYMLACAHGTLGEQMAPHFDNATAMTVVMAANGYPGTPKKGGIIDLTGVAESDTVKVFHAGTSLQTDGKLIANGGRVLNVTALGADTSAARDAAYKAVEEVKFPDGFYRTDIGYREIAREQ